jgi:hypothetical protein
MEHWNFGLVQKDSDAKKRKLLLEGTLKIVSQIYQSKEEKQKKKIKVFFPRQ